MSEEQVSEVPRRRGPAEVEQLVAEHEASGLSRRAFCRDQGLSVSTLDLYRKQRCVRGEGASPAGWVAVEVSGAKQLCGAPASGLAVALGNGRRIEVGRGFDAATLERLLPLLERI